MSGIRGFSRITLSETEWGPIKILRPLSRDGDEWGPLRFARGSEWEPFLRKVSGETLSYALHGYTKPLVEALGPDPMTVAGRVPPSVGFCRRHQNKTCSVRKDICRPGPETPECYEPDVEDIDFEEALYEVVMGWKEGYYVLVIEGSEFSL
ncbi:MAG: hypothetical protein GF334_10930 [Candidatus Altiarchaeales archaeon]|nr:hypothetical protein [Candidatus Altiarchaeales archaeon]